MGGHIKYINLQTFLHPRLTKAIGAVQLSHVTISSVYHVPSLFEEKFKGNLIEMDVKNKDIS